MYNIYIYIYIILTSLPSRVVYWIDAHLNLVGEPSYILIYIICCLNSLLKLLKKSKALGLVKMVEITEISK